jgi:hypothetical protein
MALGYIGGQFLVSGEKSNIGVDALCNGSALNVFNLAGRFMATSTTAIQNAGIDATAIDGSGNTGVSGKAFNGVSSMGVSGQAFGASNTNVGVDGNANGGALSTIGVNGNASGGAVNYGVMGTAPQNGTDYAIYSNGDLFINGVGTGSSGIFYVSDAKFKTKVDSISNALDIVSQLQPKQYFLDTTNNVNMRFSSKKQYGLIAQEVLQILPELVETRNKPAEYDSEGKVLYPAVSFNVVNYNGLFGILIKAIKEQQGEIERLQATNSKKDSLQDHRLNLLEEALNNCCNSSHSESSSVASSISVELKDEQSVVLDQNIPNPFAEQTAIDYFLPENTVRAQMLFYNSTGNLIKSVELQQKGKGRLNVFANDLTNGIYTYTLVVDGKIVATKKMIKQ